MRPELPSLPGALRDSLLMMTLAMALQWLGILAGGWLGWQLLRQNGRMLLRLERLEQRLDELEFGQPSAPPGLPLGSPALDFELPDLAGARQSLAGFRGEPLLLLFFNPACGFCQKLAPKLAEFANGNGRGNGAQTEESKTDQRLLTSTAAPRLLMVTTGETEANRQLCEEQKLSCPVLVQEEMEVAAAYKANGTPTGYLISAEGKIASELAVGAEALLALLSGPSEIENQESKVDQSLLTSAPTRNGEERAARFKNHSLARSRLKRDGLKAGTVAPNFSLPRLDGRGDLSLEDLRGRHVLLVFSSPHCGPCNTLAPELEKFHRAQPDITVVMISRGEPGENRAKVKEHRLTFPIALQQQWEISRLYAMFATPVLYLIDEAGVIAHDVAVGVDAILQLMQGIEDKPCAKRVKSLPTEKSVERNGSSGVVHL